MKIFFICSKKPKSQEAFRRMTELYGQASADEAEYIVVLSGDGAILRAFHENFDKKIPVYGMNLGKVGFLANDYSAENLPERIGRAVQTNFHPLRVIAERSDGETFSSIAVNEVYLLRETHQSAKIEIKVDGVLKMKELVCDGLISSTPIGSSAYNYSAGGPIIPVGSKLTALTPISSFRPRNWRGAVLPEDCELDFEVIDHASRPVCVVADYVEFRRTYRAKVFLDKSVTLTLLFDKDNTFKNKIINEQFLT
ncbi:MAG: NAD kinase [Holosporaceae bacterium]|nr:NAD kinase [Holosporaceae bacterium]